MFKRIKPKKYEASFYYERVLAVDFPGRELSDDEIVEARNLDARLNDVYFEMPDIREAFGYAKELITNPNCESFRTVLDRYFIPYALLQWGDIYSASDAKASTPAYSFRSKPFLNKHGDTYDIRISVWCLNGKETLPKF